MDDERRTGGEGETQPGGILSRIVVVDDHPLFRSALLRVLDSEATFEVVGEADDGEEAAQLLMRLVEKTSQEGAPRAEEALVLEALSPRETEVLRSPRDRGPGRRGTPSPQPG